ncbi:hypothetical protein H9P43_003710 [Blastocladiella emersonii ATCC 22665]|nr:hypothetical protein H9P43_003710 [Blastocladiella emersonii ATCC 22665]
MQPKPILTQSVPSTSSFAFSNRRSLHERFNEAATSPRRPDHGAATDLTALLTADLVEHLIAPPSPSPSPHETPVHMYLAEKQLAHWRHQHAVQARLAASSEALNKAGGQRPTVETKPVWPSLHHHKKRQGRAAKLADPDAFWVSGAWLFDDEAAPAWLRRALGLRSVRRESPKAVVVAVTKQAAPAAEYVVSPGGTRHLVAHSDVCPLGAACEFDEYE